MKKFIRLTLTLAAAFFSLLLVVVFIPLFTDITESTSIWISIPVVILAGWFAWKSQVGDKIGVIPAIFTGAILIGGISFAVGFFGPMILMPDANQGPLLGILITGPIGLVVGVIAGFIYWMREKRAYDKSDSI